MYLGQQQRTWVTLAVPFAQKDEAKALGCRWDPVRRVWEAPQGEDMSAFARWMPPAHDSDQATQSLRERQT